MHSRASSPTRIAFVNVGQGDAILIRSGSADVLIDGGPEGSDGTVAAAMKRIGMRDLDTVVVSHMHADHMAASDELSKAFDPERLLVAGRPYGQLKRAARSGGARIVQVRRGATYRWGAVNAKVLSPAGISGDANADSIVLLLEVAGRRLLLTGDLTGPNENIVAGICARGPPLYLLKVAHHGSGLSTDSELPRRHRPAVRRDLGRPQLLWPSRPRDRRAAAPLGGTGLHDAEERHDHPDDQALRIRQVAVHEDVTAADDGFYCTLNVSHAVVAAVCVAVCAMEACMR